MPGLAPAASRPVGATLAARAPSWNSGRADAQSTLPARQVGVSHCVWPAAAGSLQKNKPSSARGRLGVSSAGREEPLRLSAAGCHATTESLMAAQRPLRDVPVEDSSWREPVTAERPSTLIDTSK